MSNVKISDLTENTNPSGSEELVYADNGSNGKMTLDTIKTYAATSGAYVYKGSVATFEDLPSQNLTNGDAYNVQSEFILNGKEYPADTNVAWNGSSWDALGGSASGYQKTKYRTNVEIDPNIMVDKGESIIKTNVLYDSNERIYYTAWFNSGESTVYIYTSQYDGSIAERTLEHTFDAGFTPLSGVCSLIYLSGDGGLGSRYSLILWNHEKMAVFYAPKASLFHYSNETHYCLGDTIDWSIPFSSVYDINMFDPSEFQVGSLTFAGLWGNPQTTFGKIAFGDDYSYVNTITGWNGQDFYNDWLAPQPGTVVTCKNIKYQYLGGNPEALYFSTVNNASAVWCIAGSNVVAKQTNNNDGITNTTLFDAHIDVGSNKTLGAFSTSGGIAGGKLRGPIDLSEYYLGYGAKDLFLKTTDTSVLKTTNLKASWGDNCTDNETYRGAVIKEQVEGIRSIATPINNWKYKYSDPSYSLNYGSLVVLQGDYGAPTAADDVGLISNYGNCKFAFARDGNNFELAYHVAGDRNDYSLLDQNGNVINIISQNAENFSTLRMSEDGTKIMYTTEGSNFGYYELPSPYDFEHINGITYEASFVSAVENAGYSVNYSSNNWVTPDGQYLYIQSGNNPSCYWKFSINTPFDPASGVTYVDETRVLYDGTSHTEKVNLGYSTDGMYFQLHKYTYKLNGKYNLVGFELWNTISDNEFGGNSPSTPIDTCFLSGNGYLSPSTKEKAPSRAGAINAVTEKNEPKSAVEEIERIATPFVLTPSDSNNLWSTTYNANLWGSTTDTLVARRGPCPEGYHIPSLTEWNNVTTIISNITGSGINVEEMVRYCLMLPLGGVLSGYSDRGGQTGGQKAYVGDRALYLSSDSTYDSMNDIYYANGYMLIDNGTSSTTGLTICNGGFIRPFRNVDVAPDGSWTTRYDGGANGFAAGSGAFINYDLGLISISSDGINWTTIANKNLGAATYYDTASYPDCTQENSGNFYQWGNNYGFPYAGTTDTTTELVDVTGYGPDNYYGSGEILSITLSDFVTYYQTPSDNYLICAGNNLKPGTEYKLMIDNNSNNKVGTIDNDTIIDMFGINATIDNEAQIITFIALDDSTLCIKEVQGTANEALVDVAKAFIPVTDTTSTSALNITNLTTVFTPTENFTLSCGDVLPGMSYIVRLTSGATAYTMTLNASITNPYNETLTLTASKTTTIVLLATSDTELEIQSVRTATSSSPR